jgi:iron only hydrogenase large subunit-like protein
LLQTANASKSRIGKKQVSVPKTRRKLQAQLEAQRRTVDVDHFDITTRELVRMVEEKELERAPSYQRKFRWTEEDESRLRNVSTSLRQ